MLAVSNGKLWLLITPWSKRGFFYEEWTHGGSDWHRVVARATDCPVSPWPSSTRSVNGRAGSASELGAEYPRVVRRVQQLARCAALLGRVSVVVDATGVGDPIVDLMRLAGIEGELVPVKITSRDHATRDHGQQMVPKSELMVGLQVLVAQEVIGIAPGLPLRRELMEKSAPTSAPPAAPTTTSWSPSPSPVVASPPARPAAKSRTAFCRGVLQNTVVDSAHPDHHLPSASC